MAETRNLALPLSTVERAGTGDLVGTLTRHQPPGSLHRPGRAHLGGNPDPMQEAAVHDPTPVELRGEVGARGEGSEDLGPCGCGASAPQSWRGRVQHLEAPDLSAPGVAEQRAVADPQREGRVQRQADQVTALAGKEAGADRHRGGAHMEQRKAWQPAALAADTAVEDGRRAPGTRGDQRRSPLGQRDVVTGEVQGDPGRAGHLVDRFAQRLQPPVRPLPDARDVLGDVWREPVATEGVATVPLLLGIPFGIKDSVGVAGLEAKNGTHAYSGNVALKDSTIVAKLREAGAVIIGHTIASAFSGSIAGTFAGNAWNKDFIPGGSSQGSGVAPVARLAAAAIGEETGGSIIMPAAANGASGIKPSLGASSTAGVMPLSPGYDVLGPIARSVRDAALVLSVMVGPDGANDPLTLSAPIPFPDVPTSPRRGRKPLAGTTIGVPQTDWMTRGGTGTAPASTYDPDHLAAFERFKNQLRTLGAKVVDFDGLDVTKPENDPYFRTAERLPLPDGTVVSPASAVLSPNRYEIRYWEAVKQFAATHPDNAAALSRQFGDFDAATANAGKVTAAVRDEGERRRRTLQTNFQKALDDAGIDFMLVLPIGAQVGPRFGGSQLPNYRTFYQLPNALAWPMVTFPIGSGGSAALPINAAFWGPRFSEPEIIQAAIDFQAAFPAYHDAALADPVVTPPMARRRMAEPEEVPPELSNDPLIAEEVWARANRS